MNDLHIVTLMATSDANAVQEPAVTVTHAVVPGSDEEYTSSLQVQSVSVEVVEAEIARVLITPTALSIEEGESGMYDIRLTKAPATGEEITIEIGGGSADITVDDDDRNFVFGPTAADDVVQWDVVQTVTVGAASDGEDEGEETETLRHVVTTNNTEDDPVVGAVYDDATGTFNVTVTVTEAPSS